MVCSDCRRINNAYATVPATIPKPPITTGNTSVDGIIKWTQQYGPLALLAGVGTFGAGYFLGKSKSGGFITSILSLVFYAASLPLIGFGGYSIISNASNSNRTVG